MWNQAEMGTCQQSEWKNGTLKLGNAERLGKKEKSRCRRRLGGTRTREEELSVKSDGEF